MCTWEGLDCVPLRTVMLDGHVDIVFPSPQWISLGSLDLRVISDIWRQQHCKPVMKPFLQAQKGKPSRFGGLCYVHASFICSKVCRVTFLAEQEDGDKDTKGSVMVLALTKTAHTGEEGKPVSSGENRTHTMPREVCTKGQ